MQLSDLDLRKFGNTIQLAGAVYTGEGKTYLCMCPNEDAPEKEDIEVLLMDSDEWKEFLRQSDFLEVEVLAKAADGTVTKAIARKSQRQIDQVISWNVYRRDKYQCRYCGRGDVPLTVDHIICWEAGGPTTEENLVAACKKCNRTRGDMPYCEWILSPYYKEVSRNLEEMVRAENERNLPNRIDKILRVVHMRSR